MCDGDQFRHGASLRRTGSCGRPGCAGLAGRGVRLPVRDPEGQGGGLRARHSAGGRGQAAHTGDILPVLQLSLIAAGRGISRLASPVVLPALGTDIVADAEERSKQRDVLARRPGLGCRPSLWAGVGRDPNRVARRGMGAACPSRACRRAQAWITPLHADTGEEGGAVHGAELEGTSTNDVAGAGIQFQARGRSMRFDEGRCKSDRLCESEWRALPSTNVGGALPSVRSSPAWGAAARKTSNSGRLDHDYANFGIGAPAAGVF